MDVPRLTAQDRCDRCSAAALVIAILPSGSLLLFCGHHFNDHGSKLCDVGATIVDNREKEKTDK